MILWSHDFTWRRKNVISPSTSRRPMKTSNLVQWWNKFKGSLLPTHMSLRSCGHVMSNDSKKHYISTFTAPISIKLGTVVTYVNRLPFTKSHVHLIMWSHDFTSHDISSATRPINRKLAMMLGQGEGLPFSKLYVSLVMWSCDVIDKMKTYLHFHKMFL